MSKMNPKRNIEILLVEDNPGDIRLTREAFEVYKIANTLSIVTDGEMALDYLNKKGTFKNVSTPDLILLDLNIPKKDGMEVLEEIKKSPKLKTIPVIILSTSENDADIRYAYENYANCYITKPIDLDSFMNVFQQFQQFWLSIAQLPNRTNRAER